MSGLGEGIAFAGLAVAAAALTITGNDSGSIWFVVVMWAVLTDWGQK